MKLSCQRSPFTTRRGASNLIENTAKTTATVIHLTLCCWNWWATSKNLYVWQIKVYDPTKGKDNSVKYKFYSPLVSLEIVLSIINAKIGKERVHQRTDSHSLQDISNLNETWLKEFPYGKNTPILSPCFPHRRDPQKSWTSSGGTTFN